MNVGAMSVSRSVHTVSAIIAVDSNRDIGPILPKKSWGRHFDKGGILQFGRLS